MCTHDCKPALADEAVAEISVAAAVLLEAPINCYFNSLFDHGQASSTAGDVEMLQEELLKEQQLRLQLHSKLKALRNRSRTDINELQAELLDTQNRLAQSERSHRISENARFALEAQNTSLQQRLQEVSSERAGLERELHDRMLLEPDCDPTTPTPSPAKPNKDILTRDDSAFKADPPMHYSKLPGADASAEHAEMLEAENMALTGKLVTLKLQLAEAAERDLHVQHELALLRQVNSKFASQLAAIITPRG